jgi:AraC-like DNA-binding protein
MRPPPRHSLPRLAVVEEGSVRMGPILVLPELLAEMGEDPVTLVTEAGFDPALFESPENTVSFADLGRLIAFCAMRTDCPSLGLRIGERGGLDVMGIVGELARHSPDVGSALRNITLYLHLHDRGAIPTLCVNGDRAMLAYVLFQPDVPGTELIYDGAVAISYNILKALAGPAWEASEVCFCRPRPADIEPYSHFFCTALRFGAEHNGVVFPAFWLDRPLDGTRELVHRQIMREIDALETRGAGDLAAQLRLVLRRLLIGGACKAETSLARVAELFAIHRRTINRRLRAEGTSFKGLIDETRYEIARQLLRDTGLPITEVAAALDYTDPAAFDHAFRRWSGTSPSAWRAVHAPD